MLAVIVTTPAGSNPQAGAPNVTFGDPPPTPPDRGAPPKPTDASPAKVPAKGGVKVTITGTGFTGATSVTFDKLPSNAGQRCQHLLPARVRPPLRLQAFPRSRGIRGHEVRPLQLRRREID